MCKSLLLVNTEQISWHDIRCFLINGANRQRYECGPIVFLGTAFWCVTFTRNINPHTSYEADVHI